jgi:hypothetical protein
MELRLENELKIFERIKQFKLKPNALFKNAQWTLFFRCRTNSSCMILY